MRRPRGNTLAEYALPLALLVGVAGVIFWGLDSNQLIQNFIAATVQGEPVTGDLQIRSLGMMEHPYDTQTLRLTLQNGRTVEIPNVPTRLSDALETTGVSGSTRRMASILQTLADRLKNELSPTDYNALKSLADKGLRMAQQEAIIEKALAQYDLDRMFPGPTYQNPKQPTQAELMQLVDSIHARRAFINGLAVTDVDGNQTTIGQLAPQLGYSGPAPWELQATLAPNENIPNAGTELSGLLSAYQNASQTSLMQDPTVASLVSNLVGRIVLMGDYVESTMTVEEMRIMAQTTKTNADTICRTGGGQGAQGYTCQ
jgi:hypothetical protein